MLEKDLWADIRKNIKGPHWQRIETGTTASGVPDVNGCLAGREVWLELKILVGTKIRLTALQVLWLRQRWHHGGRSFVLAKHPKTKRMYLGTGFHAAEIQKNGIKSPFITPIQDHAQLNTLLFHVGRDVLEGVANEPT